MSYFESEQGEEEFYRHLPSAENLTIKREFIVAPLVLLAFFCLMIALFILGVIRFSYYQAQASQNRITRIILSPPRGEILDRNGTPLAVNHAVYHCYFISSDDIEKDIMDITELGKFLGHSDAQLVNIVESRRETASERSIASELWATGWGEFGARSILVKRDLNQVEVTAILERRAQFPRAFLERAYRRSYPAGESAAQIVGYMWEISEGELEEWESLGYRMGDMVGKAGLERQYDNLLRGRPGERLVAVDARGRIRGEAEMVPAVVPESGAVVVRGERVAVLRDGDVVNFPGGVKVTIRDGVLEAVESGYGLVQDRERAVQRTLFIDNGSGGRYEDFSVFRKPGEIARVEERVVMIPSVIPPTGGSALRTTIDLEMQRSIDEILGDHVGGVVVMDPRDGSILAMVSEPGYDPNLFAPGGVDLEGWQDILEHPHYPLMNRPIHNIYVPGSTFKIVTGLAAGQAGITNRTWTCRGSIEVGDRIFHCWKRWGHGTLDFTDALAQSCDVAFWTMGRELGYDRIAEMAGILGLGEPLGIDLPGERGGLIPDEAWKKKKINENWYLGDTLNMSIGQGFVQLTILQIASITATVANGGYLVPPHLNHLLTPAPTTIERISVDDAMIDDVRVGMRACVTVGTGKICNPDWIELAGKTGTADDPPREDPHSWFTSFGPYENPTLVIIVFCENGGHGDETAAPMALSIWECDAVRGYLEEQN